MSWQAANVRTKRRAEAEDSHQHKETVEAALNRLAKAYSAAMNCVGAWNRASDSQVARKLGQAARRTFEQAVLLDPTNEHATFWRHAAAAAIDSSGGGGGVPLRSAGHRATVEQLAYLSLVNYADLLLAGCPRSRRDDARSLLDRGLVKLQQHFREETCWQIITNEIVDTASATKEQEKIQSTQNNAMDVSTEKDHDEKNQGAMDVSIEKEQVQSTEKNTQDAMDVSAGKAPSKDESSVPGKQSDEAAPLNLSFSKEESKHTSSSPHKVTASNDDNSAALLDTGKGFEMGGKTGETEQAQDLNVASRTGDVSDRTSAAAVKHPAPDGAVATKIITVREESEEATVRLALAAYLDATAIDDSDPILWIKLACAARRLGRLLRAVGHPTALLPYRRLEKEALERSIQNRLAKRVWEEWQAEESMDYQYPPVLRVEEPDPIQVLSIPRPSWVTLGRLLSRCSADRIQLQFSPLLALPQGVLGRICQFLDASQIARFEATCRALSAMIVTARAALDHQQQRRASMGTARSAQAVSRTLIAAALPPADNKSDSSAAQDDFNHRASRVSKRLQSQIITSGKRTERQSRRSSVDFCLLATILGCRANNPEYRKLVAAETTSGISTPAARSNAIKALPESSSSLWTFVESLRSEDPTTSLFAYVVHVSRHVRDVFGSDPSGATLLTSTFLDCFEILARRRGLEDGMTCRWWNSTSRPVSRMDLFAMDLLNAELCLLRCEREDIVDSKSLWVARMAPHLLSLLDEGFPDEWNALKTRCHWLNATFYLWRGRLTHNVSESREAEVRGLSAIKEAISCLKGQRILTPHLVSSSRKGAHWKELASSSLNTFCQEIQASSVLLQAQEQFLNVVASMDEGSMLSASTAEALSSIGATLHARYEEDSLAKYSELITDFLAEHGERLIVLSSSEEDNDERNLQSWFDSVVPTTHISEGRVLIGLDRPCILTIMLCCMQTKTGQQLATMQLMIRLCASIVELAEDTQSQLQESQAAELSFYNEQEDSSESDDEVSFADSGLDSGNAEKGAQRSRLRQYSVFLRLLLSKLTILIGESSSADADQQVDLTALIRRGLSFLAKWFDAIYTRTSKELVLMEDLHVFITLQELYKAIQRKSDPVKSRRNRQVYASGLIRIIHEQRRILATLLAANCDRQGRSVRSRIVRRRADFVAAVSCDLALLLSECPVQVIGSCMTRSEVFESEETSAISKVSVLCESLLWLWRSANASESAVGGNGSGGSSFDRLSAQRLRIPVASMIVGLCGSASSTVCAFSGQPVTEEKLGLTDFYDSDTSTIYWLADKADGEGNVDDSAPGHLLRVIGQIVHCVSQIFKPIDEKEAVNFDHVPGYHTCFGPLLPLVIVRVLNRFADRLLLDFSEKRGQSSLWQDYPYGTRSTGRMLDSILYKAYKCLHGFTLVNVVDNKDSSGSSAPCDPNRQNNKPESAPAAAMLYRCIMRAYAQGRKSPPKAALDAVLAALPPTEATPQSDDIRKYLFSEGRNYAGLRGLCSFVTKGPEWEASFADVENWVSGIEEAENGDTEDEVSFVRRGLSRLISQGPIPQYLEAGSEGERRSASAQAEEELSRKFYAILDCLCLGNASDYEAWYKAAQCLIGKADLIADRLGLSRGFSRSAHFFPSDRADFSEQNRSVSTLIEQRNREASQLLDEGWIQCLGRDLSVYADYSWSSLQSLRSCSRAVRSEFQNLKVSGENKDQSFEAELQAWQEIEILGNKHDLADWQQAWGGLFVSALRKMAFRCVRLALYILYKRESPEDQTLISEVTESLGVNLYAELVGSQVYGYPMQPMTVPLKREIAEAALSCFQKAVDSVTMSQEAPLRQTWDLRLMIGKCHEKIAKSYWRENFSKVGANNEQPESRRYEESMVKSLHAYHSSLREAKKLEAANELVAEGSGGSSHGSCEVLYRLHASRLKCLIRAVARCQDDREQAEIEALRLTEAYWHSVIEQTHAGQEEHIRDRVWNVLVDVVAALVQCRLDFQFFHRSVYRHAQALMWAPILSDPEGARAQGCLGTVPATRACKLRGLNYATDSASSAVVVMGSLFEKKRPQLCAVWVTSDSSDSSLQALNSSVRKYDSLRGKYISAYIDSLRLCKRRNELETFLKWTYSAKRDLPSYFVASAILDREKVPPHSRDCLLVKPRAFSSFHFLTTVKRQANSALADVIFQEIHGKSELKDGKTLELLLKVAYACYLRLNCDVNDITKRSAWYHRTSGMKNVVKALTTAHQRSTKEQSLSGRPMDWSCETQASTLLEAALKRCKDLFPTLSGGFFSSRKGTNTKEKGEGKGTKRKNPPTSADSLRRSYEVAVPDGLAVGDSFFTSISDGDKIKKVKLTVPDGASKTLRFSL